METGTEVSMRPFSVSGADTTHVIVELFGGDNNLSDYVMEDLQEMAMRQQRPMRRHRACRPGLGRGTSSSSPRRRDCAHRVPR